MRRATLVLAFAIAIAPRAAHALDPFEIQVYDGTQNETGELSLEGHANRVMTTRANGASPPRDAHFTLETALGAGRHVELGHYLQTALLEDGRFAYAGMKLRVLLTTHDVGPKELRLGLNFELSRLPERFDPGLWGAEIRPIAAWDGAHFLAAVNPIVGLSFGDGGVRRGASLEPAAAAYAKVAGVELGAEYYAELGTTAHLAAFGGQAHYAFLAGNAELTEGVELNVGAGAGLTETSSPLVLKAILGVSLGHLWGEKAAPHAARMRPPGTLRR